MELFGTIVRICVKFLFEWVYSNGENINLKLSFGGTQRYSRYLSTKFTAVVSRSVDLTAAVLEYLAVLDTRSSTKFSSGNFTFRKCST
jgi:hypothetical protein